MRLQRPHIGRSLLRDRMVPSCRSPRRFMQSRTGGPIAAYEEGIKSGRLREDPAQRIALQRFNRLYDDLLKYTPPVLPTYTPAGEIKSNGLLSSLISWSSNDEAPAPIIGPQGIYMYGDVGCGKTFLMDTFYHSCSHIHRKKRVHFHAFMLDIHKWIHRWRQQIRSENETDPIPRLAHELTRDTWLIAFDEFQVTDVADAMILQRLFSGMFDLGAVMVATSNRAPEELYLNGLNRPLFLPFIDLLKERCEVHRIHSPVDYRLSGTRVTQVYHSPLGPESTAAIDKIWRTLTKAAQVESRVLEVFGRQLRIPETAKGVARFSFDFACKKDLGAADYGEMTKAFHTIVLSDIPVMTTERPAEARRFITLIDEIYNRKVKLICSAAAPPEKLLLAESGSFTSEEQFMFARAVSRLNEMSTREYLQAQHIVD